MQMRAVSNAQFALAALVLVLSSPMMSAGEIIAPSASAANENAASSQRAILQVTLEELKTAIQKETTIVLDARPEVFHRIGHIPGALALPRDEFDAYFAKLRPRFEKQADGRQPFLLVYCQNVSCEDARLVAAALIRNGFSRLAIFTGGWDEWERAGLSVEKEQRR